jgi:hypothetical protein
MIIRKESIAVLYRSHSLCTLLLLLNLSDHEQARVKEPINAICEAALFTSRESR